MTHMRTREEVAGEMLEDGVQESTQDQGLLAMQKAEEMVEEAMTEGDHQAFTAGIGHHTKGVEAETVMTEEEHQKIETTDQVIDTADPSQKVMKEMALGVAHQEMAQEVVLLEMAQ